LWESSELSKDHSFDLFSTFRSKHQFKSNYELEKGGYDMPIA